MRNKAKEISFYLLLTLLIGIVHPAYGFIKISGGAIFMISIVVIALFVSQLVYPMLAIAYGLDAASYSVEKNSKRKKFIGVLAIVNIGFSVFLLAERMYLFPVLLFMLIPLICFGIGISKEQQKQAAESGNTQVLVGLLALIYFVNLLLYFMGVYDDFYK